MERILFAVTSHSKWTGSNRANGAHLAEITHPYEVLHTAGYEIDFVSPKGGSIPFEHADLDDAINEKWIQSDLFRAKIENALTPDQVVAEQYRAVIFVGGHGALFDLSVDDRIARLAGEIFAHGGVIGAICHGVAGLLPVQDEKGDSLVRGRRLASFTNEEEVTVGLLDHVPFLLEDRLIEEGAEVVKVPPFQRNVVISDRVVTGQNPASSRAVAEEVRKLISHGSSAFLDVSAATIAP